MKFLLLPLCLFIFACAAKSPVQETTEIRTRLDLAEQRMMQGNPRQALRELRMVESTATRFPRYHYDVGMAWLALGDTTTARQHLALAVEIQPTYGQAWNNLGLVFQLCHQPHKAERAFSRALAQPDYATPELAAFNLSRLYQQQDQHQKALALALKAIHFNPRFVPALLLAGNLYTQTDQPQKAIACLQQAVQKDPSNTAAAMLLGQNLLNTGQTPKARRWLEFVLQNGSAKEIEQAQKDMQRLEHK